MNFRLKQGFIFAASSELFGNAEKYPQNENTKFNPRSAYGVSKIAGYYLTKTIERLINFMHVLNFI